MFEIWEAAWAIKWHLLVPVLGFALAWWAISKEEASE